VNHDAGVLAGGRIELIDQFLDDRSAERVVARIPVFEGDRLGGRYAIDVEELRCGEARGPGRGGLQQRASVESGDGGHEACSSIVTNDIRRMATRAAASRGDPLPCR
jgi:hypothetical protein